MLRTKEQYSDELLRRIKERNIEGYPINVYAAYVMEEFIGLAAEALAELHSAPKALSERSEG